MLLRGCYSAALTSRQGGCRCRLHPLLRFFTHGWGVWRGVAGSCTAAVDIGAATLVQRVAEGPR